MNECIDNINVELEVKLKICMDDDMIEIKKKKWLNGMILNWKQTMTIFM